MMTTSALMAGDVCLYARNNSRMTEWVFMEFAVGVMSFAANSKPHF
jgi:hypothetical protein